MTPLQGILVAAVTASGRSHSELARDSGLPEKYLMQMMSGQAEGTLKSWQAILDAAGCSFDIIGPPPSSPEGLDPTDSPSQ